MKANKATTYTKTEVGGQLTLKANQATTYTKTEVDNSLLLKADQATTYNKTEVDALFVTSEGVIMNQVYTRAHTYAFVTTKADYGNVCERGVLLH